MAMTDTNFPLSSAGDMDDLPRTLRRERDRQKAAAAGGSASLSAGMSSASTSSYSAAAMSDDLVPATVKRLEVPFVRLVWFFLKAVVAAIPALILLGGILWGAGELLQAFFPELIKIKIDIVTSAKG